MRLFGGSCGLMPRRRCQPGSGATRAEPVFPTKREGPARGRRRHAVVVEALAPPGAGSSRRDSYRDSRRNSVHKCPETAPRGHFRRSVYTPASPRLFARSSRVATVYTNAPKRRREAISIDLCTLLRRRPGGDAHAALAVTQPPTHTNSRSLPYDVVPLVVEVLPGDVEGTRLLVGDPDPGFVRAGVDLAHDPEAPRGRRRGDGAGDHLKRPRRPAAPVAGDLGEDAMLDLVPL